MLPIEVIYLSRRDTIDTACELLRNATPGSQVWLVAPWRLRLALSLVNLKRLQRTAEAAGLELHLVSRHFQTRALAREAAIPVHLLVPLRLRRYRRSRRADSEGLRARVVPFEGRLGPWWKQRPRQIGVGVALLSVIVILGLVGAFLAVAMALMPSAVVKLEPITQPVSASLDVTASPAYQEIDYGRAIIPARMTQAIVAAKGETPASGRLDTPDGQASGEVVFVNRTDGPITVPKGTIVRTSSGVNVRFYTVADVELPAELYGHARVAIIALDPGPTGNVKAFTINAVEGEVAHLVDVLNDSPTEGGTIERVAIVAYEDFDRVRAELIERLQIEAYDQLVSELDEEEFVPPNSLDVQVMSQQFDQVVDQKSDVLSMEMTIVARGIAIDGQSLRELAARALENSPSNGLRLIENSLNVQRSEEVRVDGTEVYFRVTARGTVAPVVDADRVKSAIRGKTVSDAAHWLGQQLQLQSDPDISVIPSWWDRVPWLPARMDIIISSG